MGQSLSAYQEGKWRPMEIRYSGSLSDDCKTCQACQVVCPVNIDPRDEDALNVGQFKGCFNCGECIDACKTVQTYQSRDGLLSFELPWERKVREHAAAKTPDRTEQEIRPAV